MPTQQQYDVTLQPLRDIDCKIAVLDFDYTLLDEISGVTTDISLSVEADSDVRRTANISMNLKNDLSVSPSQSFYWQAGNKYWFDKFVQIYTAIKDVRTDDFVWVNQGIYCINTPSISYDATSNILSFQAVDLMSKLTGMRNGQLEGMTYTVPAGSSIKGAVEGILLEQGFIKYILYDAPQETTPEDINIDAGGTAYDLLSQLRDINANWEMFFDVDGIFHWQQIPSGKVIVDPSTGETGEPQPLVDSTIWDKTYISFSYDTSFEDVKNCVEVLGKVHDTNEFATVSGTGGSRNLTLSAPISAYVDNTWIIAFGIEVDESGEPVALATAIKYLYVYDSTNTLIGSIDITANPITFGNEQFIIKLQVGATISDITLEYEGFIQPHATAIENNPESPFYIGESTRYTCLTGNDVDFADDKEIVVTDVNGTTTSGLLTIDVNPWLSADEFNAAEVYTQWAFRVHVMLADPDTPIISLYVKVAGTTVSTTIKNEEGETISLDYSQDYMLVVAKGTTSIPVIMMLYYPTPASVLPMSTTSPINLPKFNNAVRLVCSGDEYDNIYSNDLAEQRARYEIYLHSRLHDNISIETVPIYWLDVNQIIEFNLPQNKGGEKDLWLVKSINTNIGVDGTQTVTAMRYYPLYADISLSNLATQ